MTRATASRQPALSPSATEPVPVSAHSGDGQAQDCPTCEGQGWVVGIDTDQQCCGRSDWECGGQGCVGPDQIQIQVQEPCGACFATGKISEYAQ
jgi:hypothetical protein